jgi:predicted nucleotidyltransferase
MPENELGDLLNRKVDLVMKDGFKPRIGECILQEVIYLLPETMMI